MDSSNRNLFKSMFVQAKSFEEQLRNIHSLVELFADDIQVKRQELIENCQKLILYDSDEFELRTKTRDILWRKGYYDIICMTKRFIANKKPNEVEIISTKIKTLIYEGISVFKNIITKLEIEHCVGLKDIIDTNLLDDLKFDTKWPDIKETNIKNMEYVEKIIYANFISIGDLHRYLKDLHLATNDTDDKIEIYYLQAIKLNPHNGMAHNQLGTLYSGKNYEIDSIYHYIYALSCKNSFNLSEKNLHKIFYLNSKYLELNIVSSDIKQIYARFILLIDILFYDKIVDDFKHLCHQFLIDIKTNLDTIDDEILFKMTLIIFLCLYKLITNNSKKIHSINALLVAFASDLLDHFNLSMETYVTENQQRNNLFYTKYNNIYNDIKEKINSKKKEEFKEEEKMEKSRNQIPRRRRRPVLLNNDDFDTDFSDSSTDECLSLGSDESSHESWLSDANSMDEDLDIIVLKEELIYPQNDESHVAMESPSTNALKIAEIDSLKLPKKRRNSNFKVDPNLILEYCTIAKTLKPLKIIFDWMALNPDILTNCYQTNPELIHKIMRCINYLNIDIFTKKIFFDRSFIEHPNLRIDLQHLFDIRKEIPLDEDQQMKHFDLFEKIQKNIDWKLALELTSNEAVFVRIHKIVDFGFLISKNHAFKYYFCSKRRMFVQAVEKIKKKSRRQTKNKNKTELLALPLNDNDKKIKNEKLAALWLKNEVCNLENKIKLKNYDDHDLLLTPYLVIDTKAITMFTSTVKNLFKTKKFVIFVPLIVISELDKLKKGHEKVRNIIKWLEQQFLNGCPFLKPQKQHESLVFDKIGNNLVHELDHTSETFYHIVNFCNYMVSNNNTKEDKNIITFLTGEEINRDCQRILDEVPVLHEQINSFYLKYKRKINC